MQPAGMRAGRFGAARRGAATRGAPGPLRAMEATRWAPRARLGRCGPHGEAIVSRIAPRRRRSGRGPSH
eukprot:scaffold3944_cov361-Prasinococcus_capsulatus_cf.AAC.8